MSREKQRNNYFLPAYYLSQYWTVKNLEFYNVEYSNSSYAFRYVDRYQTFSLVEIAVYLEIIIIFKTSFFVFIAKFMIVAM